MGLFRDIGRALLNPGRFQPLTINGGVVVEPRVRVRQAPRGNGIALEANNLRVIHLRGLADGKDLTVVFRPVRREGHNLEIATAVRNPLDTFSRREGTRTAIDHFLAGRTVMIPGIDGLNEIQLITLTFLGHRYVAEQQAEWTN